MFIKLILLGIWCFCFHVVYGRENDVHEVNIIKYFQRTHLLAGDAYEVSFINMTIRKNSQVKHPSLLITFMRDKPLRYIFDPKLVEYLELDLHAAANNRDYIVGPSVIGTDSTTNTVTGTYPQISQHVRSQMGRMIETKSSKRAIDREGYNLNFRLFVDSSEMAGSYDFCWFTYENVSTKVDVSFTNLYNYWYFMTLAINVAGVWIYIRLNSCHSIEIRLTLNAEVLHFFLRWMITEIMLLGDDRHKETFKLLTTISFAMIILIQSLCFIILPWRLRKCNIHLKKHEILIFLLLLIFHMVPVQRDLFIAIFRNYNHTMDTIALVEVMKSALNFRLLFLSMMSIWNARDALYRNYIRTIGTERPELESWAKFLQRNYSYGHMNLHITYMLMIYVNCWTEKFVAGVPFYLYWCQIATEELLSFYLWWYTVIPESQLLIKHTIDSEDAEYITEDLPTNNKSQFVVESVIWNISAMYSIVFKTIASNILSTITKHKSDDTKKLLVWYSTNKSDSERIQTPVGIV